MNKWILVSALVAIAVLGGVGIFFSQMPGSHKQICWIGSPPTDSCNDLVDSDLAKQNAVLENITKSTVRDFQARYPDSEISMNYDTKTVSYKKILPSDRTGIISNPYILLEVFATESGIMQNIKLTCWDGNEPHVAEGIHNIQTFFDARICENVIPELQYVTSFVFKSNETGSSKETRLECKSIYEQMKEFDNKINKQKAISLAESSFDVKLKILQEGYQNEGVVGGMTWDDACHIELNTVIVNYVSERYGTQLIVTEDPTLIKVLNIQVLPITAHY